MLFTNQERQAVYHFQKLLEKKIKSEKVTTKTAVMVKHFKDQCYFEDLTIGEIAMAFTLYCQITNINGMEQLLKELKGKTKC